MAPVRPFTHQIGLERQFGVIVELRHRGSPQSVGRADAVACRLAAADHHNMLAADLHRIDAAPGIHPILCNQESSRPGSFKSRGTSAPKANTTASYLA